MDEPKIIALMEYLSSSDSEEDIEIIEHILSKKKNIIPKINNYITDVVHAYTDPQVCIILNINLLTHLLDYN